jgi:RNA polymerase sigma factor (sigma-70 family)
MEQSFPQGDRSGDDDFREEPRTEYQKRLDSGEDPRTVFEDFCRDAQASLLGFAKRKDNSFADAEEIVQDVLLKVSRNLDKMAVRPWIRTVAANRVADWYRRELPRGLGKNRPIDLEETERQAEREAERHVRPFESLVETWVDSVEPALVYLRTLVARGTLLAEQLADYWSEVAEGVTQKELAALRGLTQGRISQRKAEVGRHVRVSLYLCEILGLVRQPHREAEIRSHLDLFDLATGLTTRDRDLLREAGGAVHRDSLGLPVLEADAAEAAIRALLAGVDELHEAESRYAAAIPNPAPHCIAAPCALHTAARD